MTKQHAIQRYRSLYGRLLRLYPTPFFERFGDSMEQTFADLLHDHQTTNKALFGLAFWLFLETSVGIFQEQRRDISMQTKNFMRPALITLVILLLPLLAMQFTDEVVWDVADFAIMGVFLFVAGLIFELIAARGGNFAYRAAVAMAIVAALLLVVMNLAVGLIGNEGNPANLIYVVVLAVGFIGAIIARLQPDKMSRTLLIVTAAQLLATIFAVVLDTRWWVLAINLFFVLLFLGSAKLFSRANHNAAEGGLAS